MQSLLEVLYGGCLSDANYWRLIKKQVRGEFCRGLKQELAVVCSVLLTTFSNRNIPQLWAFSYEKSCVCCKSCSSEGRSGWCSIHPNQTALSVVRLVWCSPSNCAAHGPVFFPCHFTEMNMLDSGFFCFHCKFVSANEQNQCCLFVLTITVQL